VFNDSRKKEKDQDASVSVDKRTCGALATDTGFIFNNNKVGKFVIYDTRNGEYRLVDNWEKHRAKMKKRILAWADCVSKKHESLGGSFIPVQLSYRDNRDWEPKGITDYLQAVISQVGKDKVYGYAWALEIKPKGRNLHYHLMLYVKSSVKIRKPDKSGMWKWGSTTITRRKRINPYYLVGAVNYYAKDEQKTGDEFPKGCRKYGVWLNPGYFEEKWDLQKSAYPRWLVEEIEKDRLQGYDLSIKRELGGGWLVKNKSNLGVEIENVYKSPYVVYTDELHVEMYRGDCMQEKEEKVI
jgi:hypothetical protein